MQALECCLPHNNYIPEPTAILYLEVHRYLPVTLICLAGAREFVLVVLIAGYATVTDAPVEPNPVNHLGVNHSATSIMQRCNACLVAKGVKN